MQAGKLRHRVTFQRNIAGRNPASGAPLPPVWQDVAIVWAAVEPLSGRDLIAAKAAQSEAKKRVIIRYRAGIEPTKRGAQDAIAKELLPGGSIWRAVNGR